MGGKRNRAEAHERQNMNTLETVSRLESRLSDEQREVVGLEARLAQAQKDWAAAVGKDDTTSEGKARKALDAAQVGLSQARERLPLIETALKQARLDALPHAAAVCADNLAKIGEQAREQAQELLGHYERARTLAKEVNAAYKQHNALVADHKELCREWGSPLVPISRAERFPVRMDTLNGSFRPDFDERFRITEGNLFVAPRPEQVETEGEAA